ncbi:MAG TPA: Nramp family divalent metal transporter [Conexivisphaerales archaeon]|nr:Nramp family divalent metal transporter [Conexivisphaerales archaeon]
MRSDGRSYWRDLVAYFGPALIVSVAYMDPGNYGTDISGGSSFGYSMLWVVWLAGIMAMMLQYLSGKLGIATGYSLAELVRIRLKKRSYILAYWLAAEAATVMTDLAEFLGTVIALYLLFGIPLLYGTFLSVLDVFLIFGLTGGNVRRLEYVFMGLISTIGIGYVFEIFITRPPLIPVLLGSVIPNLSSTSRILIAVGVVGATVMPHAIFVHSALANDKVTTPDLETKRRALRLHRVESLVMFTFAGLVNAAIMVMAAVAFSQRNLAVATIEEAYVTLLPLFGGAAATMFAVTLLASGLSSSTTATIAGQAIMEGMLGRRTNLWVRRIVTRVINMVPVTIAILAGIAPLDILVYSQVALSLLLPLPLLPLWILTKDRRLMGSFVNRRITTIVSGVFIVLIVVLNALLLFLSFGGSI